MSTCLSIKQVTVKIEYWLRLASFLHGPLKQRLLHILHNKDNDSSYQGLPEDPSDLYNELLTKHKKTLDNLLKNRILKKDQMEILLPQNGDKKTYSEAFDVTLIVLLVINCTTLQPPVGGWKQKFPLNSDLSVAANTLRGREWRNFLNHTDASSIDEPAFNLKWAEGEAIYKGLGGSVTVLVDLKTMSLDPKHDLVLKSLKDFDKKQEQGLADLTAKVDNDVIPKQLKHEQDITNLNQDVMDLNTKSDENNKQIDALKRELEDMKGTTCLVDPELFSEQLKVVSEEVKELKKTNRAGQSVSNNGNLDQNSFNSDDNKGRANYLEQHI